SEKMSSMTKGWSLSLACRSSSIAAVRPSASIQTVVSWRPSKLSISPRSEDRRYPPGSIACTERVMAATVVARAWHPGVVWPAGGGGLLGGPGGPAREPCAERWRCGASCACANLAETGSTDGPGGTQCWYEETSARIADAGGNALLEERVPAFLAWT